MGHVWAGAVVVCLLVIPVPARASDDARSRVDDVGSHVRDTGRSSRQLIASAVEQSPTVADLVRRLAASDVFVYVTVGTIDIDTAKTILLAAPGPYRYVRVSINVKQSPTDQIVLLGHELQHALEIAEAADVRDNVGMAALFRRIGWSSGGPGRFETQLAQAAGARVRRDLNARIGAYD